MAISGIEGWAGLNLVAPNGEETGEVADVLITAEGAVAALIVKEGGALGLGGRQVAVPWNQVKLEGDQLRVNMTADQIGQLPEYIVE
jgi:sporulation protein YlmC with PRC-barrel domain